MHAPPRESNSPCGIICADLAHGDEKSSLQPPPGVDVVLHPIDKVSTVKLYTFLLPNTSPADPADNAIYLLELWDDDGTKTWLDTRYPAISLAIVGQGININPALHQAFPVVGAASFAPHWVRVVKRVLGSYLVPVTEWRHVSRKCCEQLQARRDALLGHVLHKGAARLVARARTLHQTCRASTRP